MTAPSVDGEFGVLPGHLPLLAALRTGLVSYRIGSETKKCAVGPGFVEAGPDKVAILTDEYIEREQIDPVPVRKELHEFRRKISAEVAKPRDVPDAANGSFNCSCGGKTGSRRSSGLYGDPAPLPCAPSRPSDPRRRRKRGTFRSPTTRSRRPSGRCSGRSRSCCRSRRSSCPRCSPSGARQASPMRATASPSEARLGLHGRRSTLGSSTPRGAVISRSMRACRPRRSSTPPEVADADFHLADGTLVPALGKAAPAHVRFGVVLLNYEGAEGRRKKARRRSEALSLATKLAEEAPADFHAAVAATARATMWAPSPAACARARFRSGPVWATGGGRERCDRHAARVLDREAARVRGRSARSADR